jgi:GDP/UDP-N,N'-diacetylbacillosamine 2-epimerase (hydrolysing)
VENFGIENYFSDLKNCNIILGNPSSGILEAPTFEKTVVNVGDKQKKDYKVIM